MLHAAIGEFAERGYAGASMQAIAEAVGVTKPVLYAHFAGKDELYLACQRRLGDRLLADIEAAMRAAGPENPGAPPAVLRAIFTALDEDRRAWTLLHDPSRPATGPIAEVAEAHRAALADLGREGVRALLGVADPVDVDAAAAAWQGLVDGFVGWWLEHPGEPAAAMAERTERLLLTVLGGR